MRLSCIFIPLSASRRTLNGSAVVAIGACRHGVGRDNGAVGACPPGKLTIEVVGLPPASLYKRRKVASWNPAYLCVSGRRFFRGWRIH
jgi:hypothetical protein